MVKSLSYLRFAAIMLAALTFGMGFCHVMELPARMAWDRDLWVATTVHGGLYRMFGTLGAVIVVATVMILGVLTYRLRNHTSAEFRLTLAAALLFALALALWWILVFPVNVDLAGWVDGPVPANWAEWRARWELGHAINTALQFIGLAALVASVLVERPRT